MLVTIRYVPQGDGVVIYRKLSNPRVPKIMLEGGLCRESERPIAVEPPGTRRARLLALRWALFFSFSFSWRSLLQLRGALLLLD